MTTVTQTTGENIQLSDPVYRQKVRPHLTEGDKGRFLLFHRETGEFILADDEEKLLHQAVQTFGYGQPLITIRVGYKAAGSLRPGLNTELTQW